MQFSLDQEKTDSNQGSEKKALSRDHDRTAVTGASAKALILKVLGQLLFTGYTIFLARVLAQDDYGAVMYTIALLTVIGPMCLLGYDRAVLKFAVIYWVQRDYPLLIGLLRRARLVGLGCCGALSAVALGLVGSGFLKSLPGVEAAILLALLVLPFWTWVTLNISFQRGLKRVASALTGFYIIRPVLATVFTAAAYYYWRLTPAAVLVLLTCSLMIVALIEAYQIRKALGLHAHRLRPRYEAEKWNEVARPLLLSSILSTVMNRADLLLVGLLLDMKAAAVYAVASRLAFIPSLVLDAVRIVISPLISQYYNEKDFRALQGHLTEASQCIFLGTAPVVVPLLLFPQFFLGWFGDSYRSGATVLIFLALGQLINALAGTVQPLLGMTNHQRALVKITIITAIFYLLLSFPLIDKFGIEGAAAATALTMAVRNIWMVLYIKRRLNIITYMKFNSIKWRDIVPTELYGGLKRLRHMNPK